MLRPGQKLALYMEDAMQDARGKMGFGVLRYSQNEIACIVDSVTAGRDSIEVTGITRASPIVSTLEEARELGAEVLLLGIAPPGGLIPPDWYPVLDQAVALGFSLINGLHDLLGPRYSAMKEGQYVWDIRVEPPGLEVARARAAALENMRVLLIGTDMSIGKMTAGLELHAEALSRGIRSAFVATGQIGITITGAGVPLDAVRVDFASGAIEREVLRCAKSDLVFIEGQGALIHPGSTANLPLLRGSCPTHLILCHRAHQTHLLRVPEIEIPPLREYIRLYEDLGSACGVFPRPKAVAVALNSAQCTDEEAAAECARIESETSLPCADPLRPGGRAKLLDSLLDSRSRSRAREGVP